MAFTIDPAQLLATARMQEAKSKAQAAANTFSDGPRYSDTATNLWQDTSAARSSGRSGAYASGGAEIKTLVPSNLSLPQSNSAQESAVYAQAGSDALKGLMGTSLSAMPQNFSMLQGIANQGIDNQLSLAHQREMNEWEIKKSKLGAGGMSTAANIIGGIGSIASFGAGQGWFSGGGSSAPSVPAGASFFSASNPVTYSSGFGTFG